MVPVIVEKTKENEFHVVREIRKTFHSKEEAEESISNGIKAKDSVYNESMRDFEQSILKDL